MGIFGKRESWREQARREDEEADRAHVAGMVASEKKVKEMLDDAEARRKELLEQFTSRDPERD